jgi:NADH:ubiquinone reductase (H+-translocating)
MTTATPSHRPHVVIVGGGFGGLEAARGLRKAPVDVTLIDRTNHYLFQPLLYQVATGLLSPSDIAAPTRFLLRRQKNAEVLMADVESIDPVGRVVRADGGRLEVTYDYLVVAPGARHSYFGHPEWERLAPGLKTLADARELRQRFLLAFEDAEKSADPAEQKALLTFVVVGGGPTGVELAGILPEIAHRVIRTEFRRIDPAHARILLLEGGPRLLPAFPEALSERARRDLEKLGVEVRTGALVTAITPDAVSVGEERIPTRTVFWAAGNAASPLIKSLGAETDRAGRALVESDLSLPGRPEVYVIGDAAAAALLPGVDLPAGPSPQWVPGLAAAAEQMGAHAARMIVRTLENQPHRPFTYRNRGELAIIGRNKAVANFGKLTLTGRFAFLTWLFVHLMLLVGFRNRVSVFLEWGYAYLTYRLGARLITDAETTRAARAARTAGEPAAAPAATTPPPAAQVASK